MTARDYQLDPFWIPFTDLNFAPQVTSFNRIANRDAEFFQVDWLGDEVVSAPRGEDGVGGGEGHATFPRHASGGADQQQQAEPAEHGRRERVDEDRLHHARLEQDCGGRTHLRI